MAFQQAMEYFLAHSDVPRYVIREQLRNAGYPVDEISKAEETIDGVSPAASIKRGKIYYAGEFFVGIFAVAVMYWSIFMVFDQYSIFAGLIGLGVQAFVAWKFWRTRRAFAFGFSIVPIILASLAAIALILLWW